MSPGGAAEGSGHRGLELSQVGAHECATWGSMEDERAVAPCPICEGVGAERAAPAGVPEELLALLRAGRAGRG